MHVYIQFKIPFFNIYMKTFLGFQIFSNFFYRNFFFKSLWPVIKKRLVPGCIKDVFTVSWSHTNHRIYAFFPQTLAFMRRPTLPLNGRDFCIKDFCVAWWCRVLRVHTLVSELIQPAVLTFWAWEISGRSMIIFRLHEWQSAKSRSKFATHSIKYIKKSENDGTCRFRTR